MPITQNKEHKSEATSDIVFLQYKCDMGVLIKPLHSGTQNDLTSNVTRPMVSKGRRLYRRCNIEKNHLFSNHAVY